MPKIKKVQKHTKNAKKNTKMTSKIQERERRRHLWSNERVRSPRSVGIHLYLSVSTSKQSSNFFFSHIQIIFLQLQTNFQNIWSSIETIFKIFVSNFQGILPKIGTAQEWAASSNTCYWCSWNFWTPLILP